MAMRVTRIKEIYNTSFSFHYMIKFLLFILFVNFSLYGQELLVSNQNDYHDQNLFDEQGVYLIYHGRRDLKQIALTIDDGWVPDYELLDFLERENVSCTVFIPGKLMSFRSQWIRKMDIQGIEIGSHGYSHRLFPFMPPGDQIKELEDTNRILFQLTGKNTTLIRPSGGRLDGPYPSLELMREQGYTVVLWENDVRGYDQHESVDDQIDWLWEHLQPGNIILSHFGESLRTKKVLEIWIPLVRERGYEFVTVSELIKGLEESELSAVSNQ
jgi:peptidoglycan/xylan/chitin deacetylase (PgdA/CDA1 family)